MKKSLLLPFVLGTLPLFAGTSGTEGMTEESFPECRVVSIQDMPMTMPGTLFRSVVRGERPAAGSSWRASLNVFLIRYREGGRNVLIDAGYGKADCRLPKQLVKLKLAPEDISAVFITHIHPDHVGGLTSPDGKAFFPKAEIFIARKEYEAWQGDPARAGLARHLAPYRERIVLMDYDSEVKPYGLVPLYYPGHTPGHTVFRMNASSPGGAVRNIWFVGDIVHAADLQIPNPEFCARFDMTPETAVRSRRALLENADRWFGAHLPFPGIIRIERKDTPDGGKQYGFHF